MKIMALLFLVATGALSHSDSMPNALGTTLMVAPDGARLGNAVVGLDSAAARLASDPTITDVILMPGVFRPRGTFRLDNSGRRVTISAERAGTAIIDGGGRVDSAMLLSGSQIVVTKLTMRNYRMNGVVIGGGNAISIVNNRFDNVASRGWSQAAIHGSEVAYDITLRGNTIRNVGYAAILFEASERGRMHNILIENNVIVRACRIVPDCGAVYAQGRTGTFHDLVITGNHIRDFGPAGANAQGIYLDDGLSDAIVARNDIAGPGGFAIQIHGGSGNRVTDNTIDVCRAEGLLFYQELNRKRMRNNVFTGNTVRANGPGISGLVKHELASSPLLPVNQNSLLTACANR